jgi:proteasome lid subunit RPN8/RPN11
MTGMAFEPVGGAFGRPWYDRRAFEGHVRFRAAGDLEVLVAPTVVVQLRSLAVDASPNEIGGLVSGRLLRDTAGEYTVVLGAVTSAEAQVSPGHIHLDAAATTRLRALASRMHAGLDVVGWWHSHAHASRFSHTDLQSQQEWTDPGHVGVLVFAHGPQWGVVYAGPGATLLESAQVPGLARNPDPTPRAPSELLGTGPVPARTEVWVPQSRYRRRRIVVGLAGMAMVALFALALTAVARSPGSVAAPDTVGYACVAEPGRLTCRTDPGNAIVWYVDGAVVGTANPITLRLKAGPHDVQGELRRPHSAWMPKQVVRIPKVAPVASSTPTTPATTPTTTPASSSSPTNAIFTPSPTAPPLLLTGSGSPSPGTGSG